LCFAGRFLGMPDVAHVLIRAGECHRRDTRRGRSTIVSRRDARHSPIRSRRDRVSARLCSLGATALCFGVRTAASAISDRAERGILVDPLLTGELVESMVSTSPVATARGPVPGGRDNRCSHPGDQTTQEIEWRATFGDWEDAPLSERIRFSDTRPSADRQWSSASTRISDRAKNFRSARRDP
jgi:hypothetical protein